MDWHVFRVRKNKNDMDSHVERRGEGDEEKGGVARWRHAMQTCRSILNRSLRSRYDTSSSRHRKNNAITCRGNASVGCRGGRHVGSFRNRIVIEVLLRDLAAVVTGLRTGVLLSHLHQESESFECDIYHCVRVMCDAICPQRVIDQEQQVDGTTRGEEEEEDQKQQHILLLTSLVDEGSLLVVSLAALKHTPYPKGIVFCKNTKNPEGLMEPAWARSSEQEALEQCFRSIHDALMVELAATTPREREHMVDNETRTMVLESCLSRHKISLGEGGYPSIPTLYGWMLGYPVTYVVVGAEHASSVSRSLSATTCVFYSVRTRMHSIYVNNHDARYHEQQTEGETEEVMAFSVPQGLLQQEDACEHLSAWQQRLSCTCQHECWAPPLCDTFSTMTGILI